MLRCISNLTIKDEVIFLDQEFYLRKGKFLKINTNKKFITIINSPTSTSTLYYSRVTKIRKNAF